VKKTTDACIKLRENLKKTRREEIKRIILVIGFCFLAGIETSKFLLLGFASWMFVGCCIVWGYIMIYSGREADLNQNMMEMGCEY